MSAAMFLPKPIKDKQHNTLLGLNKKVNISASSSFMSLLYEM